MATIDLKLKSYDELQFEIMRLNTDNYLKQQQINNLNKFIKEYGNYLDSLHLDDKGIVYRAREKWNLLLKGIDDNE